MADCPPLNVLKRLLAEALSDQERSLVEVHVEGCPGCQDNLHKLTVGAALPASRGLSLARREKTARQADPRTEALFDRLKRMNAPAEPAAPEGEPIGLVEVEGYEVLGELGRGAVGVSG